MSMNLVTLLYLIASICFIHALKGLSHPTTAVRGNYFGMAGMAIAMVTTAALIIEHGDGKGLWWVVLGLLIGGSYGTWRARTVEMTQMPELIAFFHSMIGLAAVCIAAATVGEPAALGIAAEGSHVIPPGNRIELSLGAFIGAVTFTGSVIAWGKLSGTYKFRLFQGRPVVYPGQHWINLAMGIATVVLIWAFWATQSHFAFFLICMLGFVIGVTLIIAIGGADMPVVISMLNSYSGWAAAGIGFSLENSMLIIAGSLVGSSGAILSYIMCKAMNRPFLSVILGGFGGETAAAEGDEEQRPVKQGSADDVAFMLSNADSVIIVPGYGLAVARAQHAVKEMVDKLIDKGIQVRYAIHPVAGRMPGHMNVLLAEAEVPYDQVFEMDDINSEFGETDVAIVLGANDVVNPAALEKGSSIYGMPILEAYKARSVIVNKRTMATGYAGLDNELFYMDKTMMVFGDAKKVIEAVGKAID
ncbi:MAG: NAD(P)(+) transhydrogenase (Re/Si-specific) subunit beta [Ottowia sp.]|nr:NAD(P)(+) transhydrogenase (Re/Si-specific) subunit beta [Ottowia sp.]